jgi:hypothetical protein
MNSAVEADRWAAIRAFCEGETPSLGLAAAVAGIDAVVLDERRKSTERQESEGAAA